MSTEEKQNQKQKRKPKEYKVWFLPAGPDAKPEELLITRKQATLEWMQGKVGGYITTRATKDDTLWMICDDEGLIKDSSPNALAFQWLPQAEQDANNWGFPISGDVLIVPEKLM